ncbi:TonB-dependent receptor [Sinimarinibacterium sp. NLF-5-8]|uniref:TonB-dependent receptor domain-containing protein n=1 Tax=Sinimarinibacterium sp. NLF-5-8 TaxID=2698684 RepID=UPI00137BCFCF|nr:TonB-dependent receptor [Sinimarinibacterium sp. NLF-5-8]QHS11060.1 TonB-dependent receptor [Sinimarinibacterium sp. NLF-5-8]
MLTFLLIAALGAPAQTAAIDLTADAMNDSTTTLAHAQALDPIVVVASRTAEPLSQVVASVVQIDRAQMDQQMVRDLDSLVRFVPGISVPSDAHRFGARGLSIRGLSGNRVHMVVDDVPLGDEFSVGQFAAAGRDWVDLEAVGRVEIQRGPASTLYGSDALAGAVVFRTLDPADVLAGADAALRLRSGFDGADDSMLTQMRWAGQWQNGWQAMLLASQRLGHHPDNNAAEADNSANPARARRRSVLGKIVHDAGAAGHYTATFDFSQEKRSTAVNSLRFGSGRFNTTYQLDADDAQRRARASLAGAWAPNRSAMDHLQARVYVQRGDVRQDSAQFRHADAATAFESLRERTFAYRAQTIGAALQGQAYGQWGALSHWQVYGVDVARTRYQGLRDGLEINLDSGQTSAVILGEALPVRDFPTTDSDRAALYWQDQMRLGTVTLIPGVRAEYNALRARPDAVFRDDFADMPVVNVHANQMTPKLAVRWQVSPHHSVFAQYARGFRAPPFGDVNIALTLPTFNYEVRANPELKAERSQGLELGWRFIGSTWRGSVAVFDNRYRDLIESRANLGVDPASGALVFQSVNRDRARIRGLEAEGLWHITPAARAPAWRVRAAFSSARGDDQRVQQPLNSVDPAQLTMGLQLTWAGDAHGLELASVATRRKTRIDHSAGAQFAAPGWLRWDAYFWVAPWPRVQINAGIVNLGNHRYWEWSGVQGVAPTDPDVDFYSRPGRHASVTLALDF